MLNFNTMETIGITSFVSHPRSKSIYCNLNFDCRKERMYNLLPWQQEGRFAPMITNGNSDMLIYYKVDNLHTLLCLLEKRVSCPFVSAEYS